MKQNTEATFIFICFFCLIAVMSCNHAHEGACGEDKISSQGSDDSHNFGQNCMNCHQPGGEGEGCFKIAGSVKDSIWNVPAPNVTVRLYTGAKGSGTLKATVAGDRLGNFFTTEAIDFSNYLYPAVTGTNGNTVYMTQPITSGACNSCHGAGQDQIWSR